MNHYGTPADGNADDEVQSPEGARRRAREWDEAEAHRRQLARRRARYRERQAEARNRGPHRGADEAGGP
jgi:2-methylcitrate dehydratase PrpD